MSDVMTGADREGMITVLDRRLLSPEDFVDRVVIPLLAEARREGAEQGWGEGFEAGRRYQARYDDWVEADDDNDGPAEPANPYRADKIAKGDR